MNIKGFVKKVVMIDNGIVFHSFIKYLYRILNIDNNKQSRLRIIIAELYYKIGYENSFYMLNLKDAYRFRVYHLLHIVYGDLPGDIESSKRYLHILSELDFYKWLELNDETIRKIENCTDYYRNKEIKNGNKEKNKESIGRVLIIGPLCDVENIDLTNFNTLVFLKIPPVNLNISEFKVIIVLNNQWIAEKKDIFLKWHSFNQDSYIFSPVDIYPNILRDSAYNSIPLFPFSSLMGLQRVLALLDIKFNYDMLHINGFNFYMSHTCYLPWYPLMSKAESISESSKSLVRACCLHDLAMNLLYVRKFAKHKCNIFGDSLQVSQGDIGSNLELFASYRKKEMQTK